MLHDFKPLKPFLAFSPFKALAETTFHVRGEVTESETLRLIFVYTLEVVALFLLVTVAG